MLRSLYITNYAIIDKLEIAFSEHLNIITGETGAGKSILLGALSLILGNRADTSVLYQRDKKCVVEGAFDISFYNLKDFFEKEDLDHEAITIIRREINAKGKSRAFINDTPVTLSVLKNLTKKLIDVHAQHETLELMDDSFQLTVIDALANNLHYLNKYQLHFKEYRKNLKRLQELIDANNKASMDLDYLQYILDELMAADISDPSEQERLEAELDTLTNAEEIKVTLLQSNEMMQQGEYSVMTLLNSISSKLSSIRKYNPDVEALYQRLESSRLELKDISDELGSLEEEINYDQERIEELNDRLNSIYKLQKKHNLSSLTELIDFQKEIGQRIDTIGDLSYEIKNLEQHIFLEEKEIKAIANAISKNRKNIIPKFQKNVNDLLKEVGMPNAHLKIDVTDNNEIGPQGMDKVKFLFSANPGSALIELNKVASGGELSRLMLSIKSLVAGSTALPTLVFDEIDTGISGEIGLKVGSILQKLTQQHQVICITHLPQIAAKSHRHFYVYKEVTGQDTFTRIKILEADEKILELAKMLSGEKPSAAALENARELLSN